MSQALTITITAPSLENPAAILLRKDNNFYMFKANTPEQLSETVNPLFKFSLETCRISLDGQSAIFSEKEIFVQVICPLPVHLKRLISGEPMNFPVETVVINQQQYQFSLQPQCICLVHASTKKVLTIPYHWIYMKKLDQKWISLKIINEKAVICAPARPSFINLQIHTAEKPQILQQVDMMFPSAEIALEFSEELLAQISYAVLLVERNFSFISKINTIRLHQPELECMNFYQTNVKSQLSKDQYSLLVSQLDPQRSIRPESPEKTEKLQKLERQERDL